MPRKYTVPSGPADIHGSLAESDQMSVVSAHFEQT
jgi:hypothetical protein